MQYVTVEGDVLDAICATHYGNARFDLDVVYAANLGLARLGPVFEAGVEITLPESARVTPKPTMISLVD